VEECIVECLKFTMTILKEEATSVKAILNDNPSSRVQWNRTILLAKIHKLDPLPLGEGPRPKRSKWRLNLHGTIFSRIFNLFQPKTRTKKESSWFEEPRCKLRSKARSNSKIQFASNESKLAHTNLDPKAQLEVGLSQTKTRDGSLHSNKNCLQTQCVLEISMGKWQHKFWHQLSNIFLSKSHESCESSFESWVVAR
jgi:hypothetical protein